MIDQAGLLRTAVAEKRKELIGLIASTKYSTERELEQLSLKELQDLFRKLAKY
ncbi:hypothetical protein [Bacillus suaedae]|uniref:Uncharacterized protein n=1 Tax=Halalkalibacter suaedae TaxID=2822140 RepID=A0A940WTF2_9BACI|nr:hypothetical protein [Bacillus suaedae]MBP3950312.1 hypothetical protein [Bacillus suaedae]